MPSVKEIATTAIIAVAAVALAKRFAFTAKFL